MLNEVKHLAREREVRSAEALPPVRLSFPRNLVARLPLRRQAASSPGRKPGLARNWALSHSG